MAQRWFEIPFDVLQATLLVLCTMVTMSCLWQMLLSCKMWCCSHRSWTQRVLQNKQIAKSYRLRHIWHHIKVTVDQGH